MSYEGDPLELLEQDDHADFADLEEIIEDSNLLDEVEWVAESLEELEAEYTSERPSLDEFSILSDPEISQFMEENLDEQQFHREEVKQAYEQGDDFAVTVLLSTFFESYLSTKLSEYAGKHRTILDPEEIREGEMSFHKMIEKGDKLDLFENEIERDIMKAIGSSRNQYLYHSFEHLEPGNETIAQEENLLETALDLYDSRLGISPEERISESGKRETVSSENSIQRIDETINEGSKAVSTILMDSIFQQYMTHHLNKPGNGAWYVNGSKTKTTQTGFNQIIKKFKNLRYSQENHQNFGREKQDFDRMMQVFSAVHNARTDYAHKLEAFAEGNGISDNDYEKALEYFGEIKEEVFPNSGTYAPNSHKGDKWGTDLQ